MKASQVQDDYIRDYICQQLSAYEFYDTEGRSTKELKYILATRRAMDINIDSDSNKFF
ncbi:hypothetical protein JNUCC1_03321 [Lentibacillus sp. JNUCC-1]|uniref:hypothetical protein n=1 Tax=Lentibacillus sp. JNUCC-1 TaxID=2654513 RepID=UPI0012E8B6DC|nr:hypothetical protein [Lentibacillus sp. JNUCC-1]MUV39443.1 hypothetical protein [Lentibacillus sp. JNUCC-1]